MGHFGAPLWHISKVNIALFVAHVVHTESCVVAAKINYLYSVRMNAMQS